MATDETVCPSCSFCGEVHTKRRQLIAGQGGNICESCVAEAQCLLMALELAREKPNFKNVGSVSFVASEAKAATVCSFCGVSGENSILMLTGSKTCICYECVARCGEIIEETEDTKRRRPVSLKSIEEYGIVPVAAIEDAALALPLADALIAGGLPVVEVTFRTQAAAEAIATLRRERPQLIVGAGTVLTPKNVMAAAEANALFMVAPGTTRKIVHAARFFDIPFLPGVAAPTEIEAALELDCTLLKFFHAEALGGVKMLKAMYAPYAHTGVRFMPFGGIGPDNIEEYLAFEAVAAVGGTWIASKEDIAQGRWDDISAKCREALTIASSARG